MLRDNLQIKGLIFPILPYLNFFVSKDALKQDDVEQKMFVENLALIIVKNHLLLQFVEVCG
jgi:hypothetical protein